MNKKRLQYEPSDIIFAIAVFIIFFSQFRYEDLSSDKPLWAVLLFALFGGLVALHKWPIIYYMRDHMHGIKDMALVIALGFLLFISIIIVAIIYSAA